MIRNLITRFVKEEDGLEMVEWGLVAALVVAGGGALFATIGEDTADGLQGIIDAFDE